MNKAGWAWKQGYDYGTQKWPRIHAHFKLSYLSTNSFCTPYAVQSFSWVQTFQGHLQFQFAHISGKQLSLFECSASAAKRIQPVVVV